MNELATSLRWLTEERFPEYRPGKLLDVARLDQIVQDLNLTDQMIAYEIGEAQTNILMWLEAFDSDPANQSPPEDFAEVLEEFMLFLSNCTTFHEMEVYDPDVVKQADASHADIGELSTNQRICVLSFVAYIAGRFPEITWTGDAAEQWIDI